MVFDFEVFDVCHATFFLSGDVFVEVGCGHCFVVFFGDEEVARLDWYYCVESVATCDDFASSFEVAYHVVAHLPVVERVVFDGLCGESRDEFFVFEGFEGEFVAGFCIVVVSANVGYFAFVDLHLDV